MKLTARLTGKWVHEKTLGKGKKGQPNIPFGAYNFREDGIVEYAYKHEGKWIKSRNWSGVLREIDGKTYIYDDEGRIDSVIDSVSEKELVIGDYYWGDEVAYYFVFKRA